MADYIDKINKVAAQMGEVRIMEVCGGHTNTLMKYGIREVLPDNIKLISGPGCPVCVTSQYDIDCMIELALSGVPVATYGDMFNVPGTRMSLRDAAAQGADIKMIYSVDQLLAAPERVFFAVGFETTTPMTARLLEEGITVFSAHKLIPPAMKILATDMRLDGFINPGHVSTIIGSHIWEELKLGVPQVISGFKPQQLIKATYLLLNLINEQRTDVINDYPEVVRSEGNKLALELIQKNMCIADSQWRGMGSLPASGLEPINDKLNARLIYKDKFRGIESQENQDCICGEIVRGLKEPRDCKLYGKKCTPANPVGACMVSDSEGACAISYKYGKSLAEVKATK